jgi:hypothetical protein
MAYQSATPSDAGDALVARASTEYRVKRLIIVVMLVGMGGWFAYDGFINWPRENAEIEQLKKDIEVNRADELKRAQLEAELNKKSPHTPLSIQLQKVLAFALPPIGLVVLVWSLYRSRGAYRLNGNLLHVPGHPPFPLDAVRSIDKTDWDRKGIAYINYQLPNGAKGAACLDDFIYERKPTDDIFKRIEDFTGTGDAPPQGQEAAQA